MKHPQFLVFRSGEKNISGRKGHYFSTGTDADFCERMHVSGETLFWATDESVKSLDADQIGKPNHFKKSCQDWSPQVTTGLRSVKL